MATKSFTPPKKSQQELPPELGRMATAVLLQAGRHADAQQFAESSSDASTHVLIANDCLQQGDYDQAKDAYLMALKLADYAPARQGAIALLIYQAAKYAAQEQWSPAEACLKQAAGIDPENPLVRRFNGAVQTAALMRGLSMDELEEAIPLLENLQAEDLSRADVAHQLAMIYHRQAIELEDTSKTGHHHRRRRSSVGGQEPPNISEGDQAWAKAFGNWALAIEADEYWRRWDESREGVYEKSIPDDEIEKLRHETLGRVIKEIHDQFIKAYSDVGNKNKVDRHKRLRAQWVLELDAAKGLHATVDFLAEKRALPEPLVPCGPSMWQDLNMVEEVEQLARKALKLSPDFTPAHDVLNALTPVGLAKIMLREGQLWECLDLLDQHLKQFPRDEAARSIAAETYIKLAQTVVASSLEEAIGYWVESKSYGGPRDQIEEAISQAVFKVAKKHESQDQLDEAEQVLRLGLKHAPQSKTLKDKLASIANRRAVTLVNSLDDKTTPTKASSVIQKAEKILLDADRLAGPDHPAIRKNLKDLYKLRDQVTSALVVEKVNDAVERANAAIQSFEPGQNYTATKKELEAALSDLEDSAKQAPGESVIREHITSVKNALANIARANEAGQVVTKVNQAIETANEAISSFTPGENYYRVSNALKSALNDLESAARAAPGEKVIKKHITDLKGALANVERAESMALNGQAVQIINSLEYMFSSLQYASYSERMDLCKALKEAERLLDKAYDLNNKEASIRKNREQVQKLVKAIC